MKSSLTDDKQVVKTRTELKPKVSVKVSVSDPRTVLNKNKLMAKTTKNNKSEDSDDSDDSDDSIDIDSLSEPVKTVSESETELELDKDNFDPETDHKIDKDLDKDKDKKIKKSKKSSTSHPKSERVTMYLNDDDAKPVTAAGALFYKKVGKQMKVLVIENSGKYEDIGGKIDPQDPGIVEAAVREIEEETNGQIKGPGLVERLQGSQYIYVPKSKYVIYIVEANAEEKVLKKTDFGDQENHDGFSRTIGWITREELAKPATIQYKMNWRLKSKSLFDKLMDIESQFKFKNKLFKKKNK